ncbi:MAG: DUF4010 domain-containing protein [Bryobacteraceae bacterium]|nr:DUF4010 domain-containing protein [Bryobacteraceae bacterium]
MEFLHLAASTPPVPEGPNLWKSLAEALLIGLIFGAQRETSLPSSAAGFRDFTLIAMLGAVCGLLNQPLVTLMTLGVAALAWPRFDQRPVESSGLTTRLAALTTFLLAHLTTVPGLPGSETVAVALAVLAVALLEMKTQVHLFFRQTITEVEFNDTIKFLAVIFVIYPLLPEGRFGPYGAFEPRKIWVFVMLVSSISYIGYFLERFAGGWGLRLTSLLGGIASTTAATMAFAKESRENPARLGPLWQAATLANAVQFPRVLALIAALNWPLAVAMAWPLLSMSFAGLLLSLWPVAIAADAAPATNMPLRNPLRLRPALRFGLIFAAIMVGSRAAVATYGEAAVFFTSLIGGLIDVDAVVVSTSEVQAAGRIAGLGAQQAIFVALAMNALFKTGLAFAGGRREFAWRVLGSFAAMMLAGLAMVWFRA